MKNPNQAKNKTAKIAPATPARKHHNGPYSKAPFAVLAASPFAGRESFELELDWIGDTMEPEIYQGNWARLSKRPEMEPCQGELVLGLLHTGELVFGACDASDDGQGKIIQIAFINPKYPPAYYWPESFRWLYPVEYVSLLDASNQYRRIMKTVEFISDTEGDFPLPAAL